MVILVAFSRVSRSPFCWVTKVVKVERSGVPARSEPRLGDCAMTALAMAMPKTREGKYMMSVAIV